MSEAVIPGTQVHALSSEAVRDTFEITILAPPEAEGPLPVVYCTDANNSFGAAANAVAMLTLGGEIPPVLLVGIGYPTGNVFQDFIRLRTRDFSPSYDAFRAAQMGILADCEIVCGGAENFAAFLTSELRDWLRERFAIASDHTYIGDSMGGLFGTFVLLNHPDAFDRYVIGSPWLCWDHPISFNYESDYASAYNDLDATVFLAAGEDEHVLYPNLPDSLRPMFSSADTANLTRELSDRLSARRYPSLELTTRILPNETHFTIVGALIGQGLRVVFEGHN